MTTYRCFACGEDLEIEKVNELNLVEIKPCEACLAVAEEGTHGKDYEEGYKEGYDEGYKEGWEEAKDKIEKGEKLALKMAYSEGHEEAKDEVEKGEEL